MTSSHSSDPQSPIATCNSRVAVSPGGSPWGTLAVCGLEKLAGTPELCPSVRSDPNPQVSVQRESGDTEIGSARCSPLRQPKGRDLQLAATSEVFINAPNVGDGTSPARNKPNTRQGSAQNLSRGSRKIIQSSTAPNWSGSTHLVTSSPPSPALLDTSLQSRGPCAATD